MYQEISFEIPFNFFYVIRHTLFVKISVYYCVRR